MKFMCLFLLFLSTVSLVRCMGLPLHICALDETVSSDSMYQYFVVGCRLINHREYSLAFSCFSLTSACTQSDQLRGLSYMFMGYMNFLGTTGMNNRPNFLHAYWYTKHALHHPLPDFYKEFTKSIELESAVKILLLDPWLKGLEG